MHGSLVIAGGATSPNNADIYGAFMAPLAGRPDAVIGVLPTASGVPKESASSSAQTLRRYAGEHDVRIIDLTTANAIDASNPDVVKQIDACDAIWFTGGDQSRIVETFRPRIAAAAGDAAIDESDSASPPGAAPGDEGRVVFPRPLPSGTAGRADTIAYRALRSILERGGVIGGTSAGAAMMSDPMILGGRSDDALLGTTRENSGESRFAVGEGMGFFPFGLTDQHFLRRGRLGRLVAALEIAGVARGYGVEENAAIAVDLESGVIRVIGQNAQDAADGSVRRRGAAVLVDISGVTRDGVARRGVRVSLLQAGDAVDGRTGRVAPLPRKMVVTIRKGPREDARYVMPRDERDAWSAGAVPAALHRLAEHPDTPVVLRSARFDLRFTADLGTAIHSGAGGAADDAPTIVGARLDITPRDLGAGSTSTQ